MSDLPELIGVCAGGTENAAHLLGGIGSRRPDILKVISHA